MSEIQTMPNPNRRGLGFQTVWISDGQGFGTTPQRSEIQNGHPTMIQH